MFDINSRIWKAQRSERVGGIEAPVKRSVGQKGQDVWERMSTSRDPAHECPGEGAFETGLRTLNLILKPRGRTSSRFGAQHLKLGDSIPQWLWPLPFDSE